MRILLVLITSLLIPIFAYGQRSYSSLECTWKINKEASFNIDALLKFQGRSYFERKMMKSLEITQLISVSSNEIIIKVTTSKKAKSIKLYVDGKVYRVKNREGEYISIKCTPVTNGIVIENKNTNGMITVTRRYTVGNRMINKITMTSPEGRSVSAERVFDRVR